MAYFAVYGRYRPILATHTLLHSHIKTFPQTSWHYPMPMILYNQVMAQKNQRRSLPPKYDNLSYQAATESENEKFNIHATSQAVWQSNFNTGGMHCCIAHLHMGALTLKPNYPTHGGNQINPITPNFSKSKLTIGELCSKLRLTRGSLMKPFGL